MVKKLTKCYLKFYFKHHWLPLRHFSGLSVVDIFPNIFLFCVYCPFKSTPVRGFCTVNPHEKTSVFDAQCKVEDHQIMDHVFNIRLERFIIILLHNPPISKCLFSPCGFYGSCFYMFYMWLCCDVVYSSADQSWCRCVCSGSFMTLCW